ncbi:hypothetical protein ACQ4LE_010957 [Meloidogyne hapla]
MAAGLRYASSGAVARLKDEKQSNSEMFDKDSDRFDLQQFMENEKFLDQNVFGKLEMPRSIEDEFERIEDDEIRQKQKEYEFMMLTPNFVKQPGAKLDISQMETGDETTSREPNHFRKIIYDHGELLKSDLTKPASHSNPHPFRPSEDNMPPTHSHSIAQYANFSETIQLLVDMGVDLFESTRNDPRLGQSLVRLKWERDVKPKVYWLHKQIGFSPEDLANYLSRNPYFLFQKVKHLNAHLNYLNFRRFTHPQIRKIIFESRYWLNNSIERLDARLGWLNRQFFLSSKQLRLVVIKEPKIIAFGIGCISGIVRSLNLQCGFSQKDLRVMLIMDPRLFLSDLTRILISYNYLAYVMQIENEQIVKCPSALRCPLTGLRHRHEYLFRLRKVNYIPKTPNYISLNKLLHPSDRYFAENVAETPLEDYNRFLKYM